MLSFLANYSQPQTILADPDSVNYAVYSTLESNAAFTVKALPDPLLPMKGTKNETELAHTRECHIRDAVAMVRFQKELEERLEAGETLTELTVDEILHKYRSAQDKFLVESFHTIAAYGANAAMMHYHATEEDHAPLERKGFLLVDCGGTYMDGTTDITRTYPLGPLTEEERLLLYLDPAVPHRHCQGGVAGLLHRPDAGHHRPRAPVAAPDQLPLRHRPQRQLCGQRPRRPPEPQRPQPGGL